MEGYDYDLPISEGQKTAATYILGACLLDNSVIPVVSSIIEPDVFHRVSDKMIYESILSVYDSNTPVTPITVRDDLVAGGNANRAGDGYHLLNLMNSCVETQSVEWASERLREGLIKRKFARLGHAFTQKAKTHEDVNELLDDAQQELFKLNRDHSLDQKLMATEDISDILQDAVNPRSFNGVRTGIAGLDTLITGLHGGDMVILAARPSMGKSALLCNIMHNVCVNEGYPTLLFSLEMPRRQIISRLLSSESNIPYKSIIGGDVKDTATLAKAGARVSNMNFAVIDRPNIKVSTIRSESRRVKSKYPNLGCIGVDYVQLIQSAKSYGVREQEVADVARNLKSLAVELQVPILVAAQINRSHEQGTDRRPQMASLRESGELEQTADMVGFLYRDDYYDQQAENEGQTELIIRKNRNGQIGTVYLQFMKNIMTFKDY